MPRLWSDTIDAHRRIVREATLDAVTALVAQHGLSSVTMSRIAAETGIGRATLYKYFPDLDAVLLAWHERHITAHLEQLMNVGAQAADPGRRLRDVLGAYALMTYRRPSTELAALLHTNPHAIRAQEQLHTFIQDLIRAAAYQRQVRSDVPPPELATYCLHALGAAHELTSKAAVQRLVQVTLDAIQATPQTPTSRRDVAESAVGPSQVDTSPKG